MAGRPIRRIRGGRYQLRLSSGERDLLSGLPRQLRELITAGDPTTRRVFPPAYPDDASSESAYRKMVGEELLDGHLDSLRTMEDTIASADLDHEQAEAWLGALNDLRLVLGTRLGVTEEMGPVAEDDPTFPQRALYDYLTWLQAALVSALAG